MSAGERNPIEELLEQAKAIRAANPPINVVDERFRGVIETAEAVADDIDGDPLEDLAREVGRIRAEAPPVHLIGQHYACSKCQRPCQARVHGRVGAAPVSACCAAALLVGQGPA